MTLFSVIIPCFNAQESLPQTLDAIRAQTYTCWEAICVDDGSTDATRAVIERYAAMDSRITIGSTTGHGPSCARNSIGLSWAVGDVLAFCDADDIWTPEKLAQLKAEFSDTTVDAIYGQIAFFQDTPTDSRTRSTVPDIDLTIPMLLAENPVCTMSNLAVRAGAFRDTGGFDEKMVHNEDLDWMIRLVGGGARVVGVDALQTYYRTSLNGLSSDLIAMQLGRHAAIRTALSFGHTPDDAANAVYYRYLARRALRLGESRVHALNLALLGILTSPAGFFNSPKRGVLTLGAALCATFFPPALSRALFAQ
ncbi:glycosyltransferase family 2 protein [Octadecabacter sp. 1_MG-2023]|uniref:glycosyltransferase family 2 protein n=1 Tax=unclassified Octadecabacter TaxID=196158 RepID=UPI001C083D16|nr:MULTISPECIES: glycosyltransferase family 2 protein [unclassified Octadecabacter]MBU2994497.1 glycosyltransferase [Octadecabacter sp. B2R22]MDO6734210.1 glycosyltransferase family 2 protein [Octadecabacter sp. 1_MG-2023]